MSLKTTVAALLAVCWAVAAVTKEFAIGGDFDAHEFNAAFVGLTAGERYTVTAQVVMNTNEKAGLGNGGFAEAREFVWFDESASSFTAAKWSGGKVEIGDGELTILGFEGNETKFTPDPADPWSARIVIRFRENGAYPAVADIPNSSGPVGISAVDAPNDRTELVVWGNEAWNPTGILLGDDEANVTVDLDFFHHSIRYCVNEKVLGPYSLANSVDSVSSVSFKGYSILSELSGIVKDANLVKDVNGTEYASVAAAKASPGAVEPFEPLWLSTWPVGNAAGSFTVKDQKGLITPENGMTVVKRVDKGNGVFENWYAKLGSGGTPGDAEKYIQTTVDLGLAKAITDNSVIKIGDFAVAEGAMTLP